MKFTQLKLLPVLCGTLVLPLSVSSCASSSNVYKLDPNYVGSTATILDSSSTKSTIKAQIFTVDKINGQRDNSSPYKYVYGGGLQIHTKPSSRKIPIKETILTIAGRDVYGADGAALLDFKKNKPVSGDIYFKPISGRTYEVMGELSKKSSSVWLVDKTTNKQIGRKITNQ